MTTHAEKIQEKMAADQHIPAEARRAQVAYCQKCFGVILACSTPVRPEMAHALAELMIDGHRVNYELVPEKNWDWCSSPCDRMP